MNIGTVEGLEDYTDDGDDDEDEKRSNVQARLT